MAAKAQAIEQRRDKPDSSKIQPFVLQGTQSKKLKGNPKNGRNYLQIIYLIRDITRMKKFSQLNNKRQTTQFTKAVNYNSIKLKIRK